MGKKASIEGKETKFATVICPTGKCSKQGSQIWLVRRKTDGTYYTTTTPLIRKHGELLGAPYIYNHFPKLSPQKDGRFHPKISVAGRTYSLGYYDTREEAAEMYANCRDNYYFCDGQNPDRHHKDTVDEWKKLFNSTLSHHGPRKKRNLPTNIIEKRNKYLFQIVISGTKHHKTFANLKSAISYRNEFLKEHSLPIPDDRKD